MTFLFFHKKSLIILINLRAVVTNIVTNTQNGLELKTPTHLSFFFFLKWTNVFVLIFVCSLLTTRYVLRINSSLSDWRNYKYLLIFKPNYFLHIYIEYRGVVFFKSWKHWSKKNFESILYLRTYALNNNYNTKKKNW